MIVPIVKEVYTELVADPTISFMVQTRGSHGIEIAIADALPGPSETGIRDSSTSAVTAALNIANGKSRSHVFYPSLSSSGARIALGHNSSAVVTSEYDNISLRRIL